MDPRLPHWLAQRLSASDTGCWNWTGRQTWNGYGQYTHKIPGLSRMAHRVTYQVLVGPIAEGLDLDHLCRNRLCCNPAHLEPVTRAENLRRSPLVGKHNAVLTHCRNGHEFTPENTYIRADRPGHRGCRACRLDAMRAHRERNRPQHGMAGYRNGCRCDACSDAHAEWYRRFMLTKFGREVAA